MAPCHHHSQARHCRRLQFILPLHHSNVSHTSRNWLFISMPTLLDKKLQGLSPESRHRSCPSSGPASSVRCRDDRHIPFRNIRCHRQSEPGQPDPERCCLEDADFSFNTRVHQHIRHDHPDNPQISVRIARPVCQPNQCRDRPTRDCTSNARQFLHCAVPTPV